MNHHLASINPESSNCRHSSDPFLTSTSCSHCTKQQCRIQFIQHGGHGRRWRRRRTLRCFAARSASSVTGHAPECYAASQPSSSTGATAAARKLWPILNLRDTSNALLSIVFSVVNYSACLRAARSARLLISFICFHLCTHLFSLFISALFFYFPFPLLLKVRSVTSCFISIIRAARDNLDVVSMIVRNLVFVLQWFSCC